MIITRNLINIFFSTLNITDEQICEALNSLGYEVEKYEKLYNLNTNVVLGKIVDLQKAENTNKLSLTKVKITNDKIIDIVCGASNLEFDMYVLVALPKAKLANGLEIKETTILNYKSKGMICSFSELGYKKSSFNSNNNSIVKVTGTYANDKYIGSKDIFNLLGLNDSIFECDVTLNRNYGLSAYQLIKELAFYFKKTIKNNEFELKKTYEHKFQITNDIGSDLKGLSSVVIKIDKNFNMNNIDMNFINMSKMLNIESTNINLISDYIGIETGQALILLDADKLDRKIILTNNFKDEKLKIKKNHLVLVSDDHFVSLIGINEYQKYAVSEYTKNILAISAYFDSNIIRKQQKLFSSNNSNIQRFMRFNTGIKLNFALKRFIQLLKNEKILLEHSNIKFTKKPTQKINNISIEINEINKLIGQKIDIIKIIDLLSKLDFKINLNKEKTIISITIPEIRYNILTYDDLIEEIIRLYGYNNINSKSYKITTINEKADKIINDLEIVNNIFINHNFYEVKTFSLTKLEDINNFNLFNYKNNIQLIQPLSNLHQVMRFSLLNSLLNIIDYNINHQIKDIKIFTLENIYYDNDQSNLHLAATITGDIINHKITNSIVKNSFFYLKGIFIAIIKKLGFLSSDFSYKNTNIHELFNPFQTAKVFYKNDFVGYIGAINPKYSSSLNNDIFALEINLSNILKNSNNPTKYLNLNIHNEIIRDITILSNDNSYETIINEISKNLKNLYNIKFKDYYIDDENNKWITISIIFNSENKQLTNQDINLEFDKILSNISNSKLKVKA